MRRLPTRGGVVATAIAAALVVVSAAPAAAATFTVTTTADAGSAGSTSDGTCAATGGGCTLRAAVEEANGTAGTDAVVVPAGNYVLSAGPVIVISTDMTLAGDGARTTSIDAGGDTRIFKATAGTATITGVTIEGGNGGLLVDGNAPASDLTLDRVAVTRNALTGSAAKGGGIYLLHGRLTVRDSTISANTANGSGGSQPSGGGIMAGSASASLTMENVTLADNHLTTTASASFGGGLSTATATTLKHVTFSGNSTAPGGQGGNLYQDPSSGSTTLADSILAAGSGENCAGGALVKQGHNLADDASCALPAGPIGLVPLGDHGGPTDTLPPTPGSPAVDTGSACPASGHDQRGQVAPTGSACDVGAAELGADMAASLTASAPAVAAGGSLTYVAAVRNDGLDGGQAMLEFTPPSGSAVTFVNSATGSCTGTKPVVCTFGTLAPGGGASATITVTAPARGPMTAFAHVSGSAPDPDATNDLATSVTIVTGPGPPLPDTTPPSLNGLLVLGSLSARKGGKLRYTLSEDAKLTLRLDRLVRGRPRGSRCTSAKTGKKCTRVVKVGTQTLRGKGGAVTAKLRAKWSGRKPRPGRHRLTITAIDAAGNAAKPRSIAVRVTR